MKVFRIYCRPLCRTNPFSKSYFIVSICYRIVTLITLTLEIYTRGHIPLYCFLSTHACMCGREGWMEGVRGRSGRSARSGRRARSGIIVLRMLNSFFVAANFNPSYYFNNLHFTACAWIICLQTRLFGEGGPRVISCFKVLAPIT